MNGDISGFNALFLMMFLKFQNDIAANARVANGWRVQTKMPSGASHSCINFVNGPNILFQGCISQTIIMCILLSI